MIGKQYEYDKMAECEKQLWWYRCLHETTLEKLKKYCKVENPSILDAGCGTGGLLSILHANGYTNSQGFDLSEDAVRYTANYGFSVQTLNILQAKETFAPNSFDVVICNDVICLLPDSAAQDAFDQLISLIKPGGILLMNLAVGELFRGTHDIAVDMQKRYSPKSIQELTDKSVIIKEMTYWPFLISPVIFAVRTWQRLKLRLNKNLSFVSDVSLPNPVINKSIYHLTRFENKFLGYKPWGSSLFTIFQKNPV